jgi:hypothetical protein
VILEIVAFADAAVPPVDAVNQLAVPADNVADNVVVGVP